MTLSGEGAYRAVQTPRRAVKMHVELFDYPADLELDPSKVHQSDVRALDKNLRNLHR